MNFVAFVNSSSKNDKDKWRDVNFFVQISENFIDDEHGNWIQK